MAKKYYKVSYEAGATVNNFFYPKDSVVALDIPAGGRVPLWAQECDKNGTPVDDIEEEQVHTLDPVTKKLGDALGNKLAAQAGEPSPAADAPKQAAAPAGDQTKADQIVETLKLLDPQDDAHWTKDGKPNANVVAEAIGQKVTRAEIDAAAPDFVRPAADAA